MKVSCCHVISIYIDPTYLLLIPAILLALYAQTKVQTPIPDI